MNHIFNPTLTLPSINYSTQRKTSTYSSYPHSTKTANIRTMPPKEAATTGKDDSGKRLKDLELLLTCVKSNTNTIEINYDEFMKHDDAPTRAAA